MRSKLRRALQDESEIGFRPEHYFSGDSRLYVEYRCIAAANKCEQPSTLRHIYATQVVLLQRWQQQILGAVALRSIVSRCASCHDVCATVSLTAKGKSAEARETNLRPFPFRYHTIGISFRFVCAQLSVALVNKYFVFRLNILGYFFCTVRHINAHTVCVYTEC